MQYTNHYHSPLGELTLASDGTTLTGLWYQNQKYYAAGLAEDAVRKSLPIFDETALWLDLYFQGKQPNYMPRLQLHGTPFQRAVWSLLTEIPWGATTTYGALASRLTEQGVPASARAVGGAVGRNPISIIVPCHRVVGADGRLTGYSGGTEKKSWLLILEKSQL